MDAPLAVVIWATPEAARKEPVPTFLVETWWAGFMIVSRQFLMAVEVHEGAFGHSANCYEWVILALARLKAL